ncbi:MAG: UvrD-helicase domain-containing protein [Myxococcota bacterium]|nr:UvrD-helicase domain-containing protein [Myxococcota bacterium]
MYRYPRPPVLSQIPREQHAVLEASAGTGKTYTIEHLVIDRLIHTDARLSEILVVTFTEKATGELKSRIRSLIETILEQAELCEPDGIASPTEADEFWLFDKNIKSKLEMELFSFDLAPIFTIHGFCNRLLSELAFNSGQVFKQTKVDTDIIFERAWREAVRYDFAQSPEHHERLTRWHRKSTGDRELCRLLQNAHSKGYLRNRLDISEEIQSLKSDLNRDFRADEYIESVSQLALQRKGVEAIADQAPRLEQLNRSEADGQDYLAQLIDLDLKALIRPPRARSTALKAPFPDGLSATQTKNLNRINQLSRIAQLLQAEERADVDALLPMVTKRIDHQKERDRLFEFDDLLNRVSDALCDETNTDFLKLLHERFRYGLIDEFQDTDGKQWHIFKRIFVDNPKGVLYIIGDPKQAIYGFRGADIHTYLDARDSLLNAQDNPAVRVPLRTNFRSTNAMIDAVNMILDQRDADPMLQGPIRYSEPVLCGRKELTLVDSEDQIVKPLTIWTQTIHPSGRSRSPSGAAVLSGFMDNIVGSIQQLLSHDQALFLRSEGGQKKRLMANDIYILVRTGTEANLIANGLKQAGISSVRQSNSKIFQSKECRDIIRVLKAVSRPGSESARLGALYSNFFSIPQEPLSQHRSYTEDPNFLDQLNRWKSLAERNRYGELFRDLTLTSGFMARQLDRIGGDQTLALVEQIFEVILETIAQGRTQLDQLIETLERWHEGSSIPDGINSGMRLAGEHDAVQILTIHRSKGLEAGIVFFFGGYSRPPSGAVQTVNYANQRHVLVGRSACQAFGDLLKAQAAEENERLLYVALTRSVAKLYVGAVQSSKPLAGPYDILNRRLLALLDSGRITDYADIQSNQGAMSTMMGAALGLKTDAVAVPTISMNRDRYDLLRRHHAPWIVTSYSGMKQQAPTTPMPISPAKDVNDSPMDDVQDLQLEQHLAKDLPGGKHMGRFLHEVIEELDFKKLIAQAYPDWARDEQVQWAFEKTMRRHDIDPKWLSDSQGLIYRALSQSLPLGTAFLPPLASLRCLREMEFIFPIPEHGHPLLNGTEGANQSWTVDRGLVKGFIDLIFEYKERYFWLDWKSDRLSQYVASSLHNHVQTNYVIQARLYTIGMVRVLGIKTLEDYERRFGGYLYLFLRGASSEDARSSAVYFERPSWADVVAWESSLIDDPRLPARREVAQ